jgi:hypothetical protein
LCAEIKPHVTRSVAFFLAACRHGGGGWGGWGVWGFPTAPQRPAAQVCQ